MQLNWKRIARCCCCEFAGCLFLNLFACGTAVATGGYGYYHSPLVNISSAEAAEIRFYGEDAHMTVSFAFGMVVAMNSALFGHISGAHINPSVTIGCLVVRKIHYIKGLLYLPCQLLGSLVGSALLLVMIPPLKHGTVDLFAATINARFEENVWQTIVWEMVLTFMWVLVYLITIRDPNDLAKATSPLLIGFTVMLITMTSIYATTGSCNPARALGAAVASNHYKYLWVFIVFSPIGGVIAAIVHYFLGYHRFGTDDEE